MFDQPGLKALEIKRVRYLVPYDWYKSDAQQAEVNAFMERAAARGTDVLVHFTARRGCYRTARYSKAQGLQGAERQGLQEVVQALPQRVPVRPRPSACGTRPTTSRSPTAKNPQLAAKYFLAARKACRRCTLVAADVLDSTTWSRWLQRLPARRAGQGAHLRPAQLRRRQPRPAGRHARVLRTVPGEVWLTETGGILNFLPNFPRSEKRQAARDEVHVQARRPLRHAAVRGMRSRITRLYNYQWSGAEPGARSTPASWTRTARRGRRTTRSAGSPRSCRDDRAGRRPLLGHADAADARHAAGDGRGGGRRRAEVRGPDGQRAAGARGGAARLRGRAVPADGDDVQRDRLPAARAAGRRRRAARTARPIRCASRRAGRRRSPGRC